MLVADVAVTLPKSLAHFREHVVNLLKPASVQLCVKIQLLARPTFEEALDTLKTNYNDLRGREIAKAQERKAHLLTPEDITSYYPSLDPRGPIILGSYEQVDAYLQKYLELGVSSFIIPNLHEHELLHCNEVFKRMGLS